MEPEELDAETRWSRFHIRNEQQQLISDNIPWNMQMDDRLTMLVKRATHGGNERFPLGVSWLEIAKAVGQSPIHCVKRYAYLYEQVHEQSEHIRETLPRSPSDDNLIPSTQQNFLDYCSPCASPRIDISSLENSEELESVGSPLPFAIKEPDRGSIIQPNTFQWDVAPREEPNTTSQTRVPLLKPPNHVLRKLTEGANLNLSESGSPRLVFGTQDHSDRSSSSEVSNIVENAFKGISLETALSPPISPVIRQAASNSDFPFAKMEQQQMFSASQVRQGQEIPSSMPPPIERLRPQQTSSQQSSLSTMSFGSDNPFTGSVTQSQLEEAFLDMAGSRLDASSVMLGSRFSMAQSKRLEQLQQLEKERNERRKKEYQIQ